jgi:hypothetical protein
VLLNLGLFIPMGWGAPQGSAVVARHSVASRQADYRALHPS